MVDTLRDCCKESDTPDVAPEINISPTTERGIGRLCLFSWKDAMMASLQTAFSIGLTVGSAL